MKTFRLYTGSDGQSHVEPIDLARTPGWTKGLATTQIAFRESPVGNFIDWHPAPAAPVRDHPVGPARDRPGRRLQAPVRPRRRPSRRGHHRQGPHHPRARQPAVPHRHYPSRGAIAMATKILFAPKQSDAVLEIARSLTPAGFELLIADIGTPEFYAAAAQAEYYLGLARQMGGEFFRSAPNMKLVQLLSAGYDRVDIEAARKAKVPVSNNGGANAIAVAEHTIMLILAVLKRVVQLPQRRGGRQVAGRRLRRPAGLRAVAQDPRHRGPRQHRQEGGPARGRLRHDGAVLRHRPPHRGRGGRPRRALRAAPRAAAHLRRGEPARARSTTPPATCWGRASSPR